MVRLYKKTIKYIFANAILSSQTQRIGFSSQRNVKIQLHTKWSIEWGNLKSKHFNTFLYRPIGYLLQNQKKSKSKQNWLQFFYLTDNFEFS